MTIPRKGRWLLAIPLAAVLLTTFTPTPALAEPTNPQIGISVGPDIGGQPGSMFYVHQEAPCPALPEGVAHQDVEVSFVDFAGTVTDYGPVARTNADGTWAPSEWRHIPYRTVSTAVIPPIVGQDAAPGMGQIYAKCVLSTGVVTQEFWPGPFNVGGIYIGDTSWEFLNKTPTITPGGTVQLESINEYANKYKCWTGVEGSIFGHGYVVPFTAQPFNGAWGVDVVASVETEDAMVPLPEGAYTVRVNCKAEYHPGQYQFTYADQVLTISGETPPTATCKDVLFIALAGSGQAYDGPRNISISPEVQTAYRAFKQNLAPGKTIKLRVIDYPALPVDTIWQSVDIPGNLREYLTGKNAGLRKTRDMVTQHLANCPGQMIVLAGYSQGALVVHEYLVEHARNHTGAQKQAIAAAITIADPAQVRGSDVTNTENAPENAMGICQYTDVKCFKVEEFGDIPQAYQGRTTNVCKKNDFICDHFRVVNPLPFVEIPGAIEVHKSYGDDPEVTQAGRRAAQKVNARWN